MKLYTISVLERSRGITKLNKFDANLPVCMLTDVFVRIFSVRQNQSTPLLSLPA